MLLAYRSALPLLFTALGVLAFAACGADDTAGPATDAGIEAAREASVPTDAGTDASDPRDAGNTVDARAEDVVSDGRTADQFASDTGADAPFDTGADAPVDAVVADDAGVDSGIDAALVEAGAVDSGGMCNSLLNDGQFITETNVAADPPMSGMGGTITLGIWRLTKWEVFVGPAGTPGPTANQRKTKFNFASSTSYDKVTIDLGQSTDEHDSRTYTTTATTLMSLQFCPTADTLSSEYTVTPDGKTLQLLAGQVVYTFTHP